MTSPNSLRCTFQYNDCGISVDESLVMLWPWIRVRRVHSSIC